MQSFEWILALVVGALVLAAISRRVGAPYPALLAVGGMVRSHAWYSTDRIRPGVGAGPLRGARVARHGV